MSVIVLNTFCIKNEITSEIYFLSILHQGGGKTVAVPPQLALAGTALIRIWYLTVIVAR